MQLQSGVTKKSGSIKRINRLQGFAMITPQLIGFLVFTLYPILWVVRYAWYYFDMVREIFVGFDNLLCRRNTKGKAFFRTIFFLPNIISTAIVGLVFSLMFSSFDGIINNILQSWGAISAPADWFGSK